MKLQQILSIVKILEILNSRNEIAISFEQNIIIHVLGSKQKISNELPFIFRSLSASNHAVLISYNIVSLEIMDTICSRKCTIKDDANKSTLKINILLRNQNEEQERKCSVSLIYEPWSHEPSKCSITRICLIVQTP